MKKILFGVAALGLLGLAGAGVGLKAQDVIEAKADWSPEVYETNPTRGVNTTTDRYWFAADPKQSNFWDSTPVLGIWVMYTDSSLDKAYLCNEYGNNSGADLDTIYYFDLPKDASGFCLLRLNRSWGEDKGDYHYQQVWNQSADYTRSNVSKTAMNYVKLEGNSVTVSAGAYTGAAPWTLKEVLTEFPTCSTSQDDVVDLYTNFWAGKTAVVGDYNLTNTYLDADYVYEEYVNNSKSYEDIAFGDCYPTVQEKWEKLCYFNSVNAETGAKILGAKSQSELISSGSNSNAVVTAIIVCSALVGIGAFFVARKRRTE